MIIVVFTCINFELTSNIKLYSNRGLLTKIQVMTDFSLYLNFF